VGEKGAIFVAQDGGKSWERKVSPKEISLFDVVLYGENQGIAIGVLGLILQTSDGGKTWSQIDSPVKDSLIAAKVTDRSTILVGARGTFLVSTDENKTFKEIPLPTKFYISSIAMGNHRTGFLTGAHGTIIKFSNSSDFKFQIRKTVILNF
jgi:Uncharacterized protein related to plant photosystem II stability/assembly factor